MTRIRLVFAVALFVAALLGGFGESAQAGPWCAQEFRDCLAAGIDYDICVCNRYMCLGQMCP